MKNGLSITSRRTWVLVNYLSLSCLIVAFEYGSLTTHSPLSLVISIAALLILIVTFWLVYFRTRIWHFIHASKRDLDEREHHLLLTTLRISYSVFAISVLCAFYIYSIADFKVSMVFAVCLVYFAHILPASIVAWFEKFI